MLAGHSGEPAIEPLQLPPILDLKAAAALRERFLARRGSPLRVDGSGVERLGGLCLQILLAARAAWAADGRALVFDPLSPDLEAALAVFGVTPDLLTSHEG